ncbi:MAG: hypothetical protein IJF07_02515 [Lachnospiraceae bacterium]|nr:hypothetical protein [Lachnospiraceae bacterium]
MKKYEKIAAYIMLLLLGGSLLPVMYLGRYNHPTGDDYAFGVTTRVVWEETGSFIATFLEACRGVAFEYETWQGTYSAMLLMYLPPNIFSEQAYHWVTTVLLLLFTGGMFYLTKVLICDILQGSRYFWILTAAVISMVCIQSVPSQAETFFWYNGSMYYTGYFAVTMFFWGGVCRYLIHKRNYLIPILMILAVFIAGGNYITLLPSIILMVCLSIWLFIQKKHKQALVIGLLSGLLLGGLAVSAMAPGNAVRQTVLWKIPAWKAILKSLLQGVRYTHAWVREWWILAVVILLPFFWKSYERCHITFRYPILVIGFIYGVFCSMSCPTFYTMNSTGPARAVAIVYYGFILATFICVYYAGGYFYQRHTEWKWYRSKGWQKVQGFLANKAVLIYVCCLICIPCIQIGNGKLMDVTTAKAIYSLTSGEAQGYEEEYQLRLAILEDEGVKDAVLPAFKHTPDMLYVGDLSDDPTVVSNQQVADYFDKNTIRVIYE